RRNVDSLQSAFRRAESMLRTGKGSLVRSTWRDSNSVRHKNAEGLFPSLPARNERGESWREGRLTKNSLLSPALSSFLGRRGRSHRASVRRASEIRTRAAYVPLFSSCPFVFIRG